ncbi:transglutaminase family protein [Sneathiella marina]|uniref:Transglutaminase family protein n=1 Tax=Sneathiella marina TaxID=2950108 RepID=A0ABY4W145_9PROT|nr:transglutaminase family protein [Sneathiella marina]USG60682.1 transglutaminase family protein [Sneathiella marina]
MRLKISHCTRYQYDTPLQYGLQQVRLTPKTRAGQSIHAWETIIEGGRKEVEFEDQHNNHVLLVSVDPDCTEISIRCEGDVETTNADGIIGKHGGYAPLWFFNRTTSLTEAGKNIKALVKQLGADFESDVARLHSLSSLISAQVSYETGLTHSQTTAEDALMAGHGVCQDHSHIFLSAARLMGFPARYVSGYLMMDDRIDQDATHAWAEAHISGIGWIGFDVSNCISPDERYIRVATGLDYKEAAPISGMRMGSSEETMSVSLQVQQ